MSDRGWKVLLHPEVEADLDGVPANIVDRILSAIERRLGTAPDRYGERLRQSLHGYWKLRVGDWRVVYAIAGNEVRVYGVLNRAEVYEAIVRRTDRGWPRGPR